VADRHERGLLDTSVVIDLDELAGSQLPAQSAISAITLAELSAGPHAAGSPLDRADRQARLQRIEATVAALPFDDEAARAYGTLTAAAIAAGRKARGSRAVDLLIAATAVSNGLPLYTRNGDDFRGLEDVLEVVVV
jgi:predicted nucleic acid-binding protein